MFSRFSICKPGSCADFLQRAALLADEDGLLSFALAVDGRGDAGEPCALLVLFDQHGRRVRNFLLGASSTCSRISSATRKRSG